MYKKVILRIVLPPLDANSYIVKTYKVSGSKVQDSKEAWKDFLFMLMQRTKVGLYEED